MVATTRRTRDESSVPSTAEGAVRRPLIVIVLSSTVLSLACLGARLISGSSPVAGASTQSESLSTQEFNDRVEAQLKERLGAREAEPASTVFKNVTIDWLKDVPAGEFLGIMNGGYAKALGVRCTHCHVEGDFASDDLRPKSAAREMAMMHHGINQQLARMEHLEDSPQDRFINCATCHRGRIDPHDPPAR
jgi:hypothetical protein